jgi:hypothetical protein
MSFPKGEKIQEAVLREVAQRGGETGLGHDFYQAVARCFPQLTPQDLAMKRPSGVNYWGNWIVAASMQLLNKREMDQPTRGVWRITDKGRMRIGGQPPPPPPPPPPPAPPRHEVLKQKLVEIGKALGYHTSTEEVLGPVGHRHDVLWRPGPYKKDPSHVIEVCEGGGSLNKDFAALNWVREHLGAHCLLVVTDEKDYQKAKQMFIGHPEMCATMAPSVESLYSLISKDEAFFSWLLKKH